MKAIIRLDVPEWQIGQEASIYFPDTMVTFAKCEADNTEEIYMKHYRQGRHDEAGLRDGTIMQTFSPD